MKPKVFARGTFIAILVSAGTISLIAGLQKFFSKGAEARNSSTSLQELRSWIKSEFYSKIRLQLLPNLDVSKADPAGGLIFSADTSPEDSSVNLQNGSFDRTSRRLVMYRPEHSVHLVKRGELKYLLELFRRLSQGCRYVSKLSLHEGFFPIFLEGTTGQLALSRVGFEGQCGVSEALSISTLSGTVVVPNKEGIIFSFSNIEMSEVGSIKASTGYLDAGRGKIGLSDIEVHSEYASFTFVGPTDALRNIVAQAVEQVPTTIERFLMNQMTLGGRVSIKFASPDYTFSVVSEGPLNSVGAEIKVSTDAKTFEVTGTSAQVFTERIARDFGFLIEAGMMLSGQVVEEFRLRSNYLDGKDESEETKVELRSVSAALSSGDKPLLRIPSLSYQKYRDRSGVRIAIPGAPFEFAGKPAQIFGTTVLGMPDEDKPIKISAGMLGGVFSISFPFTVTRPITFESSSFTIAPLLAAFSSPMARFLYSPESVVGGGFSVSQSSDASLNVTGQLTIPLSLQLDFAFYSSLVSKFCNLEGSRTMNLFRNRFVNLREVPLWTVRLSNVSGFITVESLATDNSFFWASLHRKPDGPSGELVLTGEVAFSESGKNSLKDIANDKCDMSRKIPANVVWPNGTFNVRVDLNHL